MYLLENTRPGSRQEGHKQATVEQGSRVMAGMFSPEMMKLAQEQMANMTPEQMQAMQRQVRFRCVKFSNASISKHISAEAGIKKHR